MTNAHIADAFDLIGDILDFQGANPFRVRAYRNAARVIESLVAKPPITMRQLVDRTRRCRWFGPTQTVPA